MMSGLGYESISENFRMALWVPLAALFILRDIDKAVAVGVASGASVGP